MKFLSSITGYIKRFPITSLMMGINIVFFFATLMMGGFRNENLIILGAIFPPLIIEYGEYYRIITGIFLHANVFHFLMNMYVLFYLGAQLEMLIGPRKQLLVYLLSGISSSLAVVYLGSYLVITVGASGAIFGIMGGLFMLTLLRKPWFHQAKIKSIQQLMAINLILTFVITGISTYGHLGGLIMGVVLFFIITPKEPYFFKRYHQSL
ncbi:MAG: rhomboid family intramembrane serine protease [Acholeplasmataceae bacterium]|jgi:rhomboid protease GluP|nr:rhomboid family intramembrane serine protease [Acholeplasmataceae bacterium]